jgi:hypothetical protein
MPVYLETRGKICLQIAGDLSVIAKKVLGKILCEKTKEY